MAGAVAMAQGGGNEAPTAEEPPSPRNEASHIGGKLARDLKAADMSSLQAVTY